MSGTQKQNIISVKKEKLKLTQKFSQFITEEPKEQKYRFLNLIHDIPDDPSDDIKRKPTLAISPKPSVKKSKSKSYNFQYSHHKIKRDINKRLGLSQNTPAFGPYAYIAEPRLHNCEKYSYSITFYCFQSIGFQGFYLV